VSRTGQESHHAGVESSIRNGTRASQ
jgi:hypothetical protein